MLTHSPNNALQATCGRAFFREVDSRFGRTRLS
ncbi:hypothetical protein BH24GEM2_BH24GEM2_09770 [soil metagenome]